MLSRLEIDRFSGFGLGLRSVHYDDYLKREIPVDFVEIISENYMIDGGRPLVVLDQICERYPVVMHGVSMSIGSADGLKSDYLARLRKLHDRVKPLWVSDHLCFTGIGGHNSHDLLPIPYTEEALDIVCANITHAQDILERPMLFENPSSYLAFSDGSSEWEFLAEMSTRTGCYLLLDVNNIYVSAMNHGFDAEVFLAGIPAERVQQIHLAGHTQGRDMLIDTHDRPVCSDVWDLFAKTCKHIGSVAVMIERDDAIPPIEELLTELDHARAIAMRASANELIGHEPGTDELVSCVA